MKHLFFALTFFICSALSAQTFQNKKNTAYLQFLGNSVPYSLKYERVLWSKNIFGISAEAGFGFSPLANQGYSKSINAIDIPLDINFLVEFLPNHFVDMGGGITPTKRPKSAFAQIVEHEQQNSWDTFGSTHLNYRFVSNKGMFFKVGYYQLYNFSVLGNKNITHTIGVGLGYSF